MSSFEITDDNVESPDSSFDLENAPVERKVIDSAFTIVVDTREQAPFDFSGIIGDFRDGYASINVKTVRKKVNPAGDYAILGVPGVAIERKSKADLFSSLATSTKRNNLIERVRKMAIQCEFAAIVIECYPQEIYEDPPEFTDLHPRSVFRTSLSWAIDFPLVHWYWCQDKEKAAQTCFRILEKYYEHKINPKYRERNKLQDDVMSAFKSGMIARQFASEFQVPYSQESELRLPWEAGWRFLSSHFLGGDFGTLYEFGHIAPSEIKPKRKPTKKKPVDKKADSTMISPLPGQMELPILGDAADENQKNWITKEFEKSLK